MEDRLRILLINPFFLIQDQYDLVKIQNKIWDIEPPLGLGSLSAYVKRHVENVALEVFDANAIAISEISKRNEVDFRSLYGLVEEKIKSFDPDIVGVSALFEFNGKVAHVFVDLAKRVKPSTITIMGGAYASYSYMRAFRNQNLDFIIRGEGERGLVQFIEFCRKQRKISEVGSLIYRENGSIQVNEPILVDDLSDIPQLDRSDFHMDLYGLRSVRLVNRYLPKLKDRPRLASISTSRGCPHKCGFCSTRLLWGNKIRHRRVADIMDEIRWLQDEFGINVISFNDDNMSADRNYFREFLKSLKELNIRWLPGGFQLSSMTDEIINLCIESGLAHFQIAFESGSDETLKKLRKPLRTEQSLEFVARVRKINPSMYIYGGWITGLPFETLEDIEVTHKFAKELDLDWCSFFCYQPYPGTELYQICVDKGYVNDDDDSIIKSNIYLLNAISTDNFSADDLVFKNYCANLEANFFNNRNLNGRGDIEQARRDLNDMATIYPTHVFAFYFLAKYYGEKGDMQNSKICMEKARDSARVDKFYEPYIKHFHLETEILN